MKDMLSVHDYLVAQDEIGDWDGEEEMVADKLNELFHYTWQRLPDDMSVEDIDNAMHGVWQQLRGSTVLLEVELDDLIDWVDNYVGTLIAGLDAPEI